MLFHQLQCLLNAPVFVPPDTSKSALQKRLSDSLIIARPKTGPVILKCLLSFFTPQQDLIEKLLLPVFPFKKAVHSRFLIGKQEQHMMIIRNLSQNLRADIGIHKNPFSAPGITDQKHQFQLLCLSGAPSIHAAYSRGVLETKPCQS